jgi:hypothetical protein
MAAAVGWYLPHRFAARMDFTPAHFRLLEVAGEWRQAQMLARWAWVVAGLSLVAAGFVWWRRAISLWVLKAAWSAFALLYAGVFRWMLVAPAVLHNADYRNFDKLTRNELWTGLPRRLAPRPLAAADAGGAADGRHAPLVHRRRTARSPAGATA